MRQAVYKSLAAQVLLGIVLGIAIGYFAPTRAVQMQPLGDGFIKLVKMLIAPIVFATVVVGIAQIGTMGEVGRIGVRALVYFEIVSSLALFIGLVVVLVWQPGSGLRIDPSSIDMASIAAYTSSSRHLSTTQFLSNIVPTTVGDAFVRGDILQVLLLSILFGLALLKLGPRVHGLVSLVEQLLAALFRVIDMIMWLAPVGAFGAIAFTVGRYGVGTLVPLGKLIAGVYVTCALFVLIVLGTVARIAGFRIVPLLRYIREEIVIVLGTSSSESVLPRLMEKMECTGCPKSIVGLVVPTGYSFNLDGTSIYMTMAAVFMAQVSGVHLSLRELLSIIGILLLASKGAAAVSGGGFIILAATISTVQSIPLTGLALLLGVDRFLSTARAITNLIGNAVATLVVARWDGQLDVAQVRAVLATAGRAAASPAVVTAPLAAAADKG
ncbi:MAG TPA: C4-dicarboxylate transporter DctA [Vicinamibacterales bacterium]|nr:C4-dicarboxylate transporter DctA [Vicinamibacterales bacterium]